MAMSAVYTTVNGRMVHESRGGVETFYSSDPLGSLVEARDASGTKVYEASYWPYGEVESETGTNPSPWGFVGLLGYLRDLAGLLYVRARHYRPNLARWQTVDPLWPDESAYGYVGGIATTWVDPSGLGVCFDPCRPVQPPSVSDACIALACSIKSSADLAQKFASWPDCVKDAIKRILKEYKGRDNNLNPSDCCKSAHSGGIPTSKDDAIAILIGIVCRATKVNCPSPNQCHKQFPDDATKCQSCCGLLYGSGSSLYANCYNRC